MRTQGDYRALAPRLPYGGQSIKVTVFVTRQDGGGVGDHSNRTVEVCVGERDAARPRRAEADAHGEEEREGWDLEGREQMVEAGQNSKSMASSSAMMRVTLAVTLVALAVAHWYVSCRHYCCGRLETRAS